jgi:hypothetical protein
MPNGYGLEYRSDVPQDREKHIITIELYVKSGEGWPVGFFVPLCWRLLELHVSAIGPKWWCANRSVEKIANTNQSVSATLL